MPNFTRRSVLSGAGFAYLLSQPGFAGQAAARSAAPPQDTDWRHYAGDSAATRYAPLDQIDASNFNDLEIAWRAKFDNLGDRPEYNFQATPLVIGGVLYTTAGTRRAVVALNARTGELLWMYRFDEGERAQRAPRRLSGRGVSYWTDGTIERILYVTIGYQLISLDARTGLPDPAFGLNGVVDLKRDLDQEITAENDDIGLHSTPCVCKDVVIVGSAHSQGGVPRRHANVKGCARGYDARTGRRLWIFHTTPRPGEFGHDTWENDVDQIGNGGVWAQISADPELELVYLPVELPTGDYSGQYRRGDALFGESLVAVDLHTGERRWHYQTVHHGLWDFDLPAAPVLVNISMHGGIVRAVALPTKQGFLFVLDRTNGRPIWPIAERPVPRGDVPGEWYSPTQPFPSRPPPFDLQGVSEDDLLDFTPDLRAEAVALARNYQLGPLYTPPTVWREDSWGVLTAPSATGGANWPGGAYDPDTHKFYIYSKTEASIFSLMPSPGPETSDFDYVASRGRAPAGADAQQGRFQPGQLTIDGLPLLRPPWGRITAFDLRRGAISWQIAHGETPDEVRNHPRLQGVEIPRTGRAGRLGVLVTKTLVICGEAGFFTTPDGRRGAMLRAYDKATGEEKGAVFMPAPQSGSPMTYMSGGQQYIVVAVSGGNHSGELLAYRLPRA